MAPFVDGPTGYCTPAGSKGYVQPLNDFATPALGEAVPSNWIFRRSIALPGSYQPTLRHRHLIRYQVTKSYPCIVIIRRFMMAPTSGSLMGNTRVTSDAKDLDVRHSSETQAQTLPN